ncbi:hypothetical protein ACQKOE_12110 [Novosphingobium sp. NPDC080210]|uniref:hypothetical protein n=1 Tax=Novosphingobium sp. NPDC080210 TaxID=3390596 RepID=UPI003D05D6C3
MIVAFKQVERELAARLAGAGLSGNGYAAVPPWHRLPAKIARNAPSTRCSFVK